VIGQSPRQRLMQRPVHRINCRGHARIQQTTRLAVLWDLASGPARLSRDPQARGGLLLLP
jgi:hypothetical protein